MWKQKIFRLEIEGSPTSDEGSDFLIVIILTQLGFSNFTGPAGLVGVALAGPIFGSKHSFCQELYCFFKPSDFYDSYRFILVFITF